MGASRSDPLVRLYAGYIGTPSTGNEVYGYWLFVAGLVAALAGIALVLPTGAGDTLRGVGIGVASSGLVLLLLGSVLRLPLPRAAILFSSLGGLVAVLGAVWFGVEFNRGVWSVDFDNNEPLVVGTYGLGLLVIALGAIVAPLLTGWHEQEATQDEEDAERKRRQAIKRARRQARQAAEEQSLQMLREAERDRVRDSDSQFELYTESSGYRWRLRHRDRGVLAESSEGYDSRRATQQGLTAVRRDAFGAALVDLTGGDAGADPETDDAAFLAGLESEATFETYREGGWGWQLVHENGTVLAVSDRGYETEDARDEGIEDVRQYARTADILRVAPATFEIGRELPDGFRWQLLDRHGEVLAEAGEAYDSRQAVRRAIDRIRRNVADAGTGDLERYVDPSGEHRWRLRHENGTVLADAAVSYQSAERAQAALERVRDIVPEAHTLDIGTATFELYEQREGGWRWRLRHRDGTALARSNRSFESRAAAERQVDRVKRHTPRASVRGRVSDPAAESD